MKRQLIPINYYIGPLNSRAAKGRHPWKSVSYSEGPVEFFYKTFERDITIEKRRSLPCKKRSPSTALSYYNESKKLRSLQYPNILLVVILIFAVL